MPPTLLVLTGLPASGKTTLGTALARHLHWPLVSKDEYKETLCEHLPDLTRAQAGPLSFALMYHVAGVVLAAGGNVVLETHFYRGVAEAQLERLVQAHPATLLQVFCHAPLPELIRRHDGRVGRGEHPHIHQPGLYSAPVAAYACSEPLELPGALLRLDTTQPGTGRMALVWVRGHLGQPG